MKTIAWEDANDDFMDVSLADDGAVTILTRFGIVGVYKADIPKLIEALNELMEDGQ